MNKSFEKIFERLEEPKFDISCGECPYMEKCDEVQETITNEKTDLCAETMKAIAKEIVQEVAEEYNNGWIPCSKRLPEIDGNTSDIVLVCGSNGFQYMAFWCDDLKWRFCECGMAKNPILWTEIVAWQPLPEPFKESD